jgi:transposase
VRHGTTSLFAALEVKSGRVLGDFHARHRSIEFRKFLDHIETAVLEGLEVHLILDNYGTHKTPLIHLWLTRHPRFHPHFTPTGASWLNLVERWFAALTEKQIRRGVHRSTRELEEAIRHYIDLSNQRAKPLCGPRRPTKSWLLWAGFVNVFLTQDTSQVGKKIIGISKTSMDLLQSYKWPGNIRELQNVIERSVIISDSENLSIDESWLVGRSPAMDAAIQPLSEKLLAQERKRSRQPLPRVMAGCPVLGALQLSATSRFALARSTLG